MAAWTDVPTEEITARAREVKFGRVLANLVVGFFFLIGWLAGRTWLILVFCAISVRYGWRQGTGAAPLPSAPRQQ